MNRLSNNQVGQLSKIAEELHTELASAISTLNSISIAEQCGFLIPVLKQVKNKLLILQTKINQKINYIDALLTQLQQQ